MVQTPPKKAFFWGGSGGLKYKDWGMSRAVKLSFLPEEIPKVDTYTNVPNTPSTAKKCFFIWASEKQVKIGTKHVQTKI